MTDWYPLTRAWVVHEQYDGVLDLLSTADPSRPLVPGQEFGIALTVTPGGGAFRTYGYLMDEGLGDAVVLDQLDGVRRLDNGRYALLAPGTAATTGTALVKVRADVPDGTPVVPRVIIGIMAEQGAKLVYSSGIEDRTYHVRRHTVPGVVLRLRPGQEVTLPPVHGELRVTGVSTARHGSLSCAPDGTVVYRAHPSHVGYDRFTRRFEDADGNTVRSDVTVHTGDLGISPGALSVPHA
ncbi:Ig-like domain-containing protein [Streptomyces roseolus]|uniref:Ig-like domain-containing protein n=1 Tax=Streptomyces roseolus TaxID=67358 RepID=UPI00167B5389|nr:Ig-like domain-containing protein [Streptomyces roseolus]GGR46666.1 hypothetical protein GCM10010282_44420 [Streptomyces roseolus]